MRGAIGIALVVLAVAGCAGDSASIPASALPLLVLQQGDVPAGLDQFDEGRQARADQPGGARAEGDRFGRLGGWKARFRTTRGADAQGPLVVESRADVFESAGGAGDELAAFEADAQGAVEPLELGDEGFLTSIQQPGFPKPLRVYVVAWRHDNAVGVVTVNGFEGSVSESVALELARNQEARIERAATG